MIDFKLPFSATDQSQPPAGGLAPLLARDMALMFSQIGVASLRASVVDMDSMAFQSAWSITERGEMGEDLLGRGLDSTFPAAMATIAQMGVAPPEQTVVRKLNPRHWAFAWRIDERLVAVAEARYRDQRDMMSPADTALVRLICDTGIRAGHTEGSRGRAQTADGSPDRPQLAWPEFGAAAPQGGLMARLGVLMMAVSALAALWMALLVVPKARDEALALQAELTRLHDMGNKSMLGTLATTLASGDYGEVQAALTGFGALGYFQGAVVTNSRQRVVAVVGAAPDARIGDGVPSRLAKAAQGVDLAVGSDRHGQLLTLGPVLPPLQASQSRLLLVGAWLICVSAVSGLMMLVLRSRERSSPTAP